jgi:hypothetical protein
LSKTVSQPEAPLKGSGELEITQLAPRDEQGKITGGRRNVEASIIVGAVSRANPATSRGSGQTRKEKEMIPFTHLNK